MIECKARETDEESNLPCAHATYDRCRCGHHISDHYAHLQPGNGTSCLSCDCKHYNPPPLPKLALPKATA